MTQLSERQVTTKSAEQPTSRWQPPSVRQGRGQQVLAALALTALIVGVPAVLAWAIGWPLPGSLQDLREVPAALSSPLAPSLVIDLLAVVAWLAWAHFAVCVLAELAAAARILRSRQTGEALRVPGGGRSQELARRLVEAAFATALATSVGVAAFSGTILTPARPAIAAASEASLPADVAAHAVPGRDAATATGPATASGGQRQTSATYPEYVVQAPHGGYYDSLWDIAERFLGDGQRWREIFQLNEGREQTDGRELARPDLIRPGWRLQLPRDAAGMTAHVVPVEPPAGPGPGAQIESAASVPMVGSAPAPDAGSPYVPPPRPAPSPPQVAGPEAGVSVDRHAQASAAADPAPCSTPGDADPGPEAEDDQDEGPVPVSALGGLLAAAAVAALATRRQRQRRRRAAGQSIALPTAPAAQAEGQLRVLADPGELTFVDEVVRALSFVVRDSELSVPDVRLGSLRHGHLDLTLAEPRLDAPAPFVVVNDGRVWRVSTAASPLLADEQAGHRLPLLPLLLTVGVEPAGTVLLDLEALGSLAVEGPAAEVLSLLTHLAAEAALAPWAEDVEILLVGFDTTVSESLESLAPERVSAVNELDASLGRVLEKRVSRVGAAGDRLASRLLSDGARGGEEVVPPLLILCAAPPSPALTAQLAGLVPEAGRGAVTVVGPGSWTGARATWPLGSPLPGVAFEAWTSLVPCQLDADRLESLADLLQVARQAPLPQVPQAEAPSSIAAPFPAPTVAGSRNSGSPDVRTVAAERGCGSEGNARGGKLQERPDDELDKAVEAFLSNTAPVSVSLLGPVTVQAAGNIEPDRRSRLTEVVAYLATHRRGVPVADFDAAIWPDRQVTLKTRNQAITRTRAWLGSDDDGVSWLRPISDGALRLSEEVLVDWELFQGLQRRASEPGRHPAAVRRDLEAAMRLVRGRPLSPLPPGRYGWLAETYLEQEIPSAVIDVAHALARSLLDDADPAGAIEVARLALDVDRYDERPWRDLLEAHHLRGEVRQVGLLVEQLLELLDVEVDDELQPETAELIERLLPRRRRA